MSLQDNANKIIDMVSVKLDPLFYKYGFKVKARQSDASIFSETLGYQNNDLELKISACVHPHDYPNPLAVSLIKKNPGSWKYVHLPEFFRSIDKLNISTPEELNIYPESNFGETLSILYHYCELMLKDIHSPESKINFR